MAKEKYQDLAVGGQAVFEGVMMRTPNAVSISVRDPKNQIQNMSFPYKTLTQRYKFLNLPILRGMINLVEMTRLGTKAINYSVDIGLDEEPKENASKFEKILHSTLQIFSVIFSFIFAMFLFKYIPLLSSEIISNNFVSVSENYVLFNFIDSLVKISIFALYVTLLTLSSSLRRVFQFHGAEHMAVHAYEKDLDLTVKNVQKQTTLHPRCGTSFLVFVFLFSVLFYTFIPKNPSFWINLGSRILALPLLVGFSYEILKLAGKYSHTWVFKLISVPGLAFQRLTTKQPDDSQVEVAIHALDQAFKIEENAKS